MMSAAPVRDAGRDRRRSRLAGVLAAGVPALLMILSFTAPVPAQDTAPPPKPKTRPCTAPEHRQFDFWVGEWDVRGQNNKDPNRPPSRSTISVINGGCAVREEYSTPTGYEGSSLNYFDPTTGKWKQFWIDNQGSPVTQIGGLVDGEMVLEELPVGNRRGRTTWTPLADGKVRQLWEASTDGGKTWKVVFDGIYTRREPAPSN